MALVHRITSAVLAGTLAGAALLAQRPPAPAVSEKATTTPAGLKYEDLRVGKGAVAEKSSRVRLLYTGWLKSGVTFDQRIDRAKPLDIALGQGRLVRGLEQGIVGMRVGGRRRIVIPAALAYGDSGVPPKIPPRADLTFDVELVGVARPPSP